MSLMPIMPGFPFYNKNSHLFILKASGTLVEAIIIFLGFKMSLYMYIGIF